MFPLRFIIFLLRFPIFLFYFPILIPSVIFISTMFKLVQYSPQVFSSELLHSQGLYFDFHLDWLDFIISSKTIFHFIFQEKGPQIIRVSEFFFLPPSLKFFVVFVVLQVQLFNHGRLWCPSALSGFLEYGISCQSVLFLFL